MNKPIFSILLALCVALAALGVLSSWYWSHSLWLAAMIGMTSYPLFHGYLIDRRLDVFEPILLFIALYGFFYISRPAYIISYGETMTLHGFYLDRETLSLALMACAMGEFAFIVGYYWGRGRKIGGRFTSVAEIDLQKATRLAWASVVIGALAYLYVIFVLGGGLEATFNTERTARYYIIAKNPYIANLTMLFGAGLLVLCFLAVVNRGEKQELDWRWRLLFSATIVYGMLDIAFSGSRRVLINIVFAVLLQRHYLQKAFNLRRVIPWAILLVIFSAGWLYVRSTMHEGTEAVRTRLGDVQASQTFDDVNTQGDNAVFDYLVAIISTVPMPYDYNYGSGLLRFIYFPIPRQVWPDKPENLSRVMTQRYDPKAYLNGGSAGASMAGELYLEFGWYGIIPFAFALGVIFGLSYRWLLANLSSQLAVLVYSCSAFSFAGDIVRGGIFGATIELAMMMLPILLLIRLSKRRQPARANWERISHPHPSPSGPSPADARYFQ